LQQHNLLPEKESKNMENKKLAAPIIILLCIMTAMLVMAPKGLATAQTAAADPVTIYMTPDNNTNVQGLFNVTITLSGTTTSNIGGANIFITFNDSIVNATRWFVPTDDANFFLPTSPAPTETPTPPDPGYLHVGPGNARVQVAVSKGGLPPVAPWGHAGIVCIIEFNVTGGLQGQTIELHMNDPSNTFLVDDFAAPIADVVINDGSYPIVPEFQFEYALLALIGLTLIAIAIRKKAFPKAVNKSL
jgi:hypothetical protein